ncbi:hypothetical protein KBB68_04035 [Candidatus Babeliales bacterium]|nr:hypothetical protein [Candidatus Babeliales bacterium]
MIIIILIALLFINVPLNALSLVYSFRVAQITQRPIVHEEDKKPDSIAPLIFDYFQKAKNFNIRENYVGGFVTYNHNFIKNYFRTDFAVAHVGQTVDYKKKVDVIEPDDILFTIGRNIVHNQTASMTVSGLLGLPTHAVNTLERVGFGNGQVGIGTQLDGVLKFKKYDFVWGSRYNYFVPRTAYNANQDKYTFTVGSIADILVAIQTNKLLGHGGEVGYGGRWGFGAQATPKIAILDRLNYMRNTFYGVYTYTFIKEKLAHRFLFSFSYGFDSKPKLYGYNAWMVLGSWGIAF